MAPGNEHHREKPTEHRSSDRRDRAGAKPHSSSQSEPRQSLTDQLLSAAGQQSGQGQSGTAAGASSKPHSSSSQAGRQSLTEQLLSAAGQQSGQSQSTHHSSTGPAGSGHAGNAAPWGQTGQASGSGHASPGPFGQQAQGGRETGGNFNASAGNASGGGCGLRLLVPVIVIAVIFLGVFGFGGSFLSGSGESGNAGGSGWNSGQTSAPANGYTIGSNLGAGNANDTWTVLMYVCGSNLESEPTRKGGGLATSNLVELTQAKLGNNVNYIIETGGATRWQNDVVSAQYLERYAMENGYMVQKERVPSASMAESSTLANFLGWGAKNYPADHYMLVIWDHGGGSITGVCNDDLYPYMSNGAPDSLTLTELRDALKQSGTTFDVIGFDTCLMATLETAEILAPYSKYMVASEETEPGSGWDYMSWPAWLAQHPGTSGADLGTVICQTYYNKCANVGLASTATLSTIDLSKIKAVSDAFENASDDIALATVDSKSLRQLHQGAGKSESYGNDGSWLAPSLNMVDLADLMDKTRDVVGSDADKVVSAIDNAVVFEAHGRNRSGASGLSVFYPLSASDVSDFYAYSEITSNTPYLQFLGVMYGVYDKYDWTKFDNYVSLRGEPVNESKVSIAYEQAVNPDGHVQLQITQGLDQVAQVEMEFYVLLEPIDTLCLMGSDNDLNGSYESGTFTDNFQNDWLTIDGNYVSATLTEQGDGYNLYYIPVRLNDEATGLLVEYDYSTNQYGVICAWDENDAVTGMAGRTGRLIADGDQVQFLFPAQNRATGEQSVIPLGTMSWHDNPTIGYEGVGDGTFAFRYVITDVLGNEQKTDLVYETFQNGRYVG